MHQTHIIEAGRALLAKGLTATEVAKELGVSRSTVRYWMVDRPPHPSRQQVDVRSLPDEYGYLLGLYLGDGCLSSHPRDVFKLRVTLDSKYPLIIEECRAAMAAVLPASVASVQDRPTNCVEVYSYSKQWPRLFPQHGPGRKHERTIELADWQLEYVERLTDQFLRGLIHSDGCRFMNTGRNGWESPRYKFTNRSGDIRQIFRDACEALGLHWTNNGNSDVYVSRKADVARMDEFIGPKA